MCKVNTRLDDPAKKQSIQQGDAQSKTVRRLNVVCADALMRAALMTLVRAHFVDAELVEAGSLTNAVLRFQEAEDGWLIVHWPSASSADREMLRLYPATVMHQIIILCGETTGAWSGTWIEAGVAGVLSDRLSATEFVSAFRSIFTGQRIVKFDGKRDPVAVELEKLANAIGSLNVRSRTILDLLCDGRSTRQIATALDLSVRTVRWHVTRLYSELNMSGRCRLVALVTRLRCAAPIGSF